MSDLTREQIAAQGQELEAAKWRLPERYRLTKEMLATADEEQRRLAAAAALPFSGMSSQDIERARSVVLAENLRQRIAEVDKEIGRAVVAGASNLTELRTVRNDLSHQLAERYAIFGRYDLAVEVEPVPEYADHYYRILEAVWRDDGEWCECGDLRGTGEQANLSVVRMFVKEEIFSPKEGKVVFLLGCSGCPGLNAVPVLPAQLRRQRGHRARALQMVRTLAPQDAEIELNRRGHTMAKLLSK